MPETKPFTMIDFYESLSTIDSVKVDFDNSYPHHTQKLLEWVNAWLPRLLKFQYTDMKNFYQAIPSENEKGLLVSDPERDHVIFIPYSLDRPEVLLGIAMVINLSQCQTFRSVINVMSHFRKDDWHIEYPPLRQEAFAALRNELYTLLREKLQ